MLDGNTNPLSGVRSSFPWIDLGDESEGAISQDDINEERSSPVSLQDISLFDSIMDDLKKTSSPADRNMDDGFEVEEMVPDYDAPPPQPERVSILQYIPVDRMASLNEAQIRALDPTEFTQLSNDKLQALSPSQLAWFSPAQLNALRINDLKPEQISSLSPASVSILTPGQIAEIEPAKLQSMTTQQLDKLTAMQVSRINPRSLEALRPEQLHAAVHDRQSALTTEQLTGLSRSQMESVTNDLLMGMLTIREIKALSVDSLRRMAPADVARLLPGQIGALSVDQLRALKPEQVAAIGGNQAAGISDENLSVILSAGDAAAVRKVRSSAQLSVAEFKDLSPKTLSRLSSPQLESLIRDHGQHFSQEQYHGLLPDQVRGLTKSGRDALLAVAKTFDKLELKPGLLWKDPKNPFQSGPGMFDSPKGFGSISGYSLKK